METHINNELKLLPAAADSRGPWGSTNCRVGTTSGQTMASDAAPPLEAYKLIPLFLGKWSQNLVFILDTSEDMRAVLGSVKRLLIQTLLTKASLRDSVFNIVTFSDKVNCWSHHMLPCAPDIVYKALSWIHSISCSPGRDLLAALSMALTDPACHAVHLLTGGRPDQPEAVLRALPTLAAGRPVNIFYLSASGGQLDSNTQDFLQCLGHAARGSCYLIPMGSNGELEKVIPLHVAASQTSVPTISTVKSHSQSSSVLPHRHDRSFPLLRCSLGNSLRPVTSCMLSGLTLGSAEFLPGCRVLARRELDGLYYLGSVIQEVQARRGVWVVEFDHPGTGLGIDSSEESQQQLVCSLDMVDHITAQTHCLAPGDAVLSPWEPGLRRYGPGRVMAGMEHRADGATGLRVLLWSGCVVLVPGSVVVSIPASHHDRIVRELQIAASAPSSCNWLCARSSSCTPLPRYSDCCRAAPTPCYCQTTPRWPSIVPPMCACSLGKTDRLERAEPHWKVDLLMENLKDRDTGKSEAEAPSSCSSLSEDSSRVALPPSIKMRSNQQRPPWRYWRRSGSEPQHRQPGSAAPRRTSQPARFSYPVLQISASPNHSSLFQPLPGSKGRPVNIRDVVGQTNFRPHPPFSGNATAAVYT